MDIGLVVKTISLKLYETQMETVGGVVDKSLVGKTIS